MNYTVRFAHLDSFSVKIGDMLRRGRQIGVMGNTGSGTGAHLHLDVVEGEQAGRYTLGDIADHKMRPSAKQAVLFVDAELFGVDPEITTGYADLGYWRQYGKVHCAFDLVPFDRNETKDHYVIHWNRSVFGRVVQILENDTGYGNCVMVSYEI